MPITEQTRQLLDQAEKEVGSVDKLISGSPPSTFPGIGETFIEETVGGAKQFAKGVISFAQPSSLKRPVPDIKSLVDIAIGAGRTIGALPAEVGVQLGRATAFGLEKTVTEPVLAEKVGQGVATALQFVLPDPTKKLGIVKKSFKGVRKLALDMLESLRSAKNPIIRASEDALGELEIAANLLSRGQRVASRKARKRVSNIIEPALDQMKGARPAVNTRKAVENIIEEGSPLRRRTDESLAAKAEKTVKSGIELTLETLGLDAEIIDALKSRELSAREFDALRKVFSRALVKARASGDDAVARGLRKGLTGIEKDIKLFGNEFPQAVSQYQRGLKQYLETVVPFFSKGAKLRRISDIAKVEPSRAFRMIKQSNPEDLRRMRQVLPVRSFRAMKDAYFGELIRGSFDENQLFQLDKFLWTTISGDPAQPAKKINMGNSFFIFSLLQTQPRQTI